MYSKDQLQDALKAEAKNSIFERDFAQSFNKYLGQKKNNVGQSYSEQVDKDKYRLKQSEFGVNQHPAFVIPGDGNLKQMKWASLMKDACFYYDLPTIREERKMKFALQRKYDDLFVDSNWRPPLQSRRDLVTWSCE